MSPIIGITTCGRRENEVSSVAYNSFFATPTDYIDAIRRVGGTAILLPAGETRFERWLDVVDGVIFSGGADLMPARYGGDAAHPRIGSLDPERDETEFALIDALLARPHIPALLICRGMQALNVALGGSLHEHIADIHPENVHQGKDTFWTEHPVTVTPGSRLAAIAGDGPISVRSGNHQGVKELAPGLRESARAGDGIVAALEHPEHRFLLGVQWHPETTASPGNAHQRIFEALVTAAANGRMGDNA